MKKIEDDNELLEIHESGIGYIYNDYAGLKGDPKFNVLHEASCPTCDQNNPKGMRAKIRKFFFEDINEAKDWLNKNRTNHYKFCGICME